MSDQVDRFQTAGFLAWKAENAPHCQDAFKIGARELARRWWAGGYGDVAALEASGNWQVQLMLRLGRSLEAATGDGATHDRPG